ncbi:MAG: tol-pal system protein YbgF [Deltaproteobacteria bacterium]|nr:tol-pal system protein YbgF [Deltaproteobacteria bacterium]
MATTNQFNPRLGGLFALAATAAALAALTGCSQVTQPSANMWHQPKAGEQQVADQAPAPEESDLAKMDDDTLRRELARARRENLDLRRQQEEVANRLKAVEASQRKDREAQQKYQEMMSTNFDLLEQSVSLSLGNQPGRKAAAQPSAQPASQPEPALGAAQERKHKGSAFGAQKAAVRPNSTAKPAAGAATLSGAAEDDETVGEDPDLAPPAHPRRLSNHSKAMELYKKGFSLFANGNYKQAVIVLEDFLKRYPDDNNSDNAQFWIGESYFQMKAYDQAERGFRNVLRHYEHRSTQDGYKTPDAIYRLGVIFIAREKTRQAEYYLSEVVARYPDSSAAQKAQRELDALQMGTAGQPSMDSGI